MAKTKVIQTGNSSIITTVTDLLCMIIECWIHFCLSLILSQCRMHASSLNETLSSRQFQQLEDRFIQCSLCGFLRSQEQDHIPIFFGYPLSFDRTYDRIFHISFETPSLNLQFLIPHYKTNLAKNFILRCICHTWTAGLPAWSAGFFIIKLSTSRLPYICKLQF
jgi:hypothetical protein